MSSSETEQLSSSAEETTVQDAPNELKPNDSKACSRRSLHKRGITVAVVACVLVLAGIGLLVWHEQPSFCSAICHTPMDAYGKTYLDGNVDAYGNELTPEEANSMAGYAHSKYMGGITCMGCHVPVLEEQVTEGVKWVMGDYYIAGYNQDGDAVLEPRSLADLTEARKVPGEEFCLNDKCHVTTPNREALFEKTKYLESEYNPHSDRHGQIACGTCHKGHTQSINYCTECHESAPVPEGWLTMAQAQDLGIIPEVNVE